MYGYLRRRLALRLTSFGLAAGAVALLGGVTPVWAAQATLIADAHVNAAMPAMNSGAISNLNVGGGYTSFLQFDLSLLPAGTTAANVSRAVLRLYVNRVTVGGPVIYAPVSSAWGEYSVTYVTQPSVGAAAGVFQVGQGGAFVAVDLTSLVQGWVTAPGSNNGLALSAGTAAVQFDSKENDQTSHAATLDVELVGAGSGAGATGATGATGVAGPIGPTGATGATGVAGPAGPASGLNYQGTYASTTNYAIGDVVVFQGSSYVSLIAANHGNTPGLSPADWGLLASGGTGSTGSAGTTGVGIAYQGVYVSATNYALDDIVTFQGSSYISLVAGNHGQTPGLNPTYWGLLSQGGDGATGATGPAGPAGVTYQGTYASTTNYALGDAVLFQGSSYVSLIASNHGNTPGLSPVDWGVLASGVSSGTTGSSGVGIAYQGVYASTTNYALDDIVTFQGSSYISLVAGNHGQTPGLSPTYWGLLSQGGNGATGATGATGSVGVTYQGTYASTTNYALGDAVVFQGSSYISLIASNHGNTPGYSPAQWGLLAASGTGSGGATGSPTVAVAYQGVYASTTNYTLNDIVLYGASSYISLVTFNVGQTPALSPTYWGLLAEGGTGIGPAGPAGATGATGAQGLPGLGYVGVYASTTNYGLSDVVEFQGSSYISLLASNHGNTPSSSPAQWGLLAAAQAGPAGAQGATGATGQAGPAGYVGATGAVGPTGATGYTGAQGNAGLVYQGDYNSVVNYGLGDVVLWQGTSYTSLIAANHGNTPSFSPQQWGVLSPQGPVGLTGAVGATGATGVQGLPGNVGPNGPIGPQGAQGIGGQPGAQGLTGAMGAMGLSGPMGPQGLAGPVGLSFQGVYSSVVNYALADGVSYNGAGYVSLIAGNHGNTPGLNPQQWALFAASGGTGATGAIGAMGPTGTTGAVGPQGLVGAVGATGSTGAQGPPVANYLGNYQSVVNYALNDAVSWQGSTYVSLISANHGNTPSFNPGEWAVLAGQGAAGATGATGAIGPTGSAGADGLAGAVGAQGPPAGFRGTWLTGTTYAIGDAVAYGGSSYVALVGNVGREPDVSPQYWSLLAAGATGATGAAGAAGPQGPTGFAGPAGATGAMGAQGSMGLTGGTGPAGATGAAGPMGATGATGTAGLAYQGTYVSATNYGLNDAVSWQGSSYISLTASNHGNTPGQTPSYWGALAVAGAGGATGQTGAVGSAGAAGVVGATGATGATGLAGAMGAAGATGLTWQGTYGSATNYALNDGVSYQGSAYISLAVGNRGNAPATSPGSWSLLASQGAAGALGATGATGGAGLAGAAGAGGATGATGSAGAVGMNFRGAWVGTTGYGVNDAVTFGGSTYIAQMSNSSSEPDLYPSAWSVLAQAGGAGPTGAAGTAATVTIGTVTTGAAGSQATVTNSGNTSASVLNFTIPQGATGAAGSGGGGGGGTSGIPFASMYHAVSFSYTYYSLNNPNSNATEQAPASALTWVPVGCTATELKVLSQQSSTITVTLRNGATIASMAATALTCSATTGSSCTSTGSVTVAAGSFLDLSVSGASGTAAAVWTAVACN